VALLAEALRPFLARPLVVVNRGVGDNTISPRTTNVEHAARPSALERVDRDVIAERPDVVLVGFGLNDLRFGTPVSVFAEDLAAVVAEIRRGCPSAKVVLLSVYHMTGFDRFPPRDRGSPDRARAYDAAIAELAERAALPLADVSAAMGRQDRLVHPDGVHPNDLGHRIIAGRVFETLATRTDLLAPR
jgi:lysophospholipase L1-like esterase